MILTLSIVAGVLAVCVAYRFLFYGFGDFLDGFCRFLCLRRSTNRYRHTPPPEYFEDDSWSSGLRFFLFLALSAGVGYFAYYVLEKGFG
jgi:hypothetical protein